MDKQKDDIISLMLEETFNYNAIGKVSCRPFSKFAISSDKNFLIFYKNNSNILIPSNWSVFKDLMFHAASGKFFYIFLSKNNDDNKLREIMLSKPENNLLFYTSSGEIFYEEVVGANIFPVINRVLKKKAA